MIGPRKHFSNLSAKSISSAASIPLSISLLAFGINNANADERAVGSDSPALETIIVIGEKTERDLLKTTSSVSVISSDDLYRTQRFSLHEMLTDIPNVLAITGTVPDIRGVKGNGAAGGFNSISGGAKARVTTIIDGVAEPFVADFTGDSGIWDIEQIEVYRGPQSTSNGRNSIAGSIYIKTADPSFDPEGAVRLGYKNNKDYVDVAAMASGPLIDGALAGRITAQYLDAQTISNDDGFTTHSPDFDLNEIKAHRIKAKLLWTITDRSNLLLTQSHNDEQGEKGRIYYSAANPWIYDKVINRDIETKSDATSLKFDSELSDSLSIDILLANMDYSWGFDSYEPDIKRQQSLSFEENNQTLDAKLNIGNANEAINGFIGISYFKREQDILNKGAFAYTGDDNYDSAALYGEFNFPLLQNLTMTIGTRWESESQNRHFVIGKIDEKLDKSHNILLPKVALLYQASPLTSVAFSAVRGYNAGGGALNFREQEYYFFDQETVNSYEISVRNRSEDGRLMLVSNIFYNNYNGYQAQNTKRSIVNVDDAISFGAELEVSYTFDNQIDLKTGIGLLRTKIKDAGDNFPEAEGNELNSAPETTFKTGIDYRGIEHFVIGLNANYIGKYFGDIENTVETTAGDYTVVNFQANYEKGPWLISGYLKNLLDEKAFTAKDGPSRNYKDGFVAIVERRSIGFSAQYNF